VPRPYDGRGGLWQAVYIHTLGCVRVRVRGWVQRLHAGRRARGKRIHRALPERHGAHRRHSACPPLHGRWPSRPHPSTAPLGPQLHLHPPPQPPVARATQASTAATGLFSFSVSTFHVVHAVDQYHFVCTLTRDEPMVPSLPPRPTSPPRCLIARRAEGYRGGVVRSILLWCWFITAPRLPSQVGYCSLTFEDHGPEGPAPDRHEGPGMVVRRRPLRPGWRPRVTEIYICGVCSCQEMLSRNGRRQRIRLRGAVPPTCDPTAVSASHTSADSDLHLRPRLLSHPPLTAACPFVARTSHTRLALLQATVVGNYLFGAPDYGDHSGTYSFYLSPAAPVHAGVGTQEEAADGHTSNR
jgi:hypothetical protein